MMRSTRRFYCKYFGLCCQWYFSGGMKRAADVYKRQEPLLRFACYVAVSYKVYGMDFQYLDTNYLFGLVEKVRPDMVKKLRENGTGRLPLHLQKRKTAQFTASANDAFAVIRITARDSTEECLSLIHI